MRLSSLQKRILLSCLDRAGKCARALLDQWYQEQRPTATKKNAQNVVTGALENLVDKECMIGEGVRTPHKWYIRSVRLTPVGRKLARKLRGEQLKMKLR